MDLTPPGDDPRPEEKPEDKPAETPGTYYRIDWRDADDEPVAAAPGGLADHPQDDPHQPEGADFDDSLAWADPHAADTAPPPVRRRSTLGLISAVLMIVLALGIVAATLWGIREFRQRQMTESAAQQAVALISAGAPPQLQQEMTTIQGYLTSGQADMAAQRLATLRSGLEQRQGGGAPGAPALMAPGGGDGQPIPESAYKDLPADAARFFREHQDLFRPFLAMIAQARKLKEQGQNVDKLREVRDRIIESARLGQQPAVEQGMKEFAGMLGGPGGGEGRGPLGRKAQQLKQQVERAARQGRDVRAVFPLMQKAEQAAQSGNMADANKYVDQALAAVRNAPRGRGGFARGPRGRGDFRGGMMAGRRGAVNPLAPFIRALLGLMATEEANLKSVADDLIEMRGLLLNQKPDEPTEAQALKPIVDRAMGEMQVMAKRRQDFTKAMRGQRGGRPGSGPMLRPGGRGQLTPEQRQAMFAVLTERLTPVLDNIRALSADEYASQRPKLIQEIVKAVLEPPRQQRPNVSQPPPAPVADPEQRVRAKMLEASKVLARWELEGKDTQQVEDLFAQARKALYARQFAEAEKLVDEACKLLGMTETPPPGPGFGTDDSNIKLNLRGRP